MLFIHVRQRSSKNRCFLARFTCVDGIRSLRRTDLLFEPRTMKRKRKKEGQQSEITNMFVFIEIGVASRCLIVKCDIRILRVVMFVVDVVD
jgi:hypothetical protein